MKRSARLNAGSSGMSLVELMVAVAILSVAILGFIGSFKFITQAVHQARGRTLATNLAQEKIENLKNLSYYALLVTTNASVDNSFSPAITYDNVNYPEESITIGGIKYSRYTFVSLAQIDNNVISTVTYTYPDTGMKQITVHVVWSEEGTRKKWTMSNLLENPNVAPLDASYTGYVRNAATTAGISGAVVKVVDNPDWNAVTDANGYYTFRVYHGTYVIRASSAGYYDQTGTQIGAPQGSNVTLNFNLTALSTGTIAGRAWMNPNLVISQVVVESNTYVHSWGQRAVEWFELFNPTTYQINISDVLLVDYQCEAAGLDRAHADFNFVFITTYVPAGKYYLIANATAFVINGSEMNADACYGTGPNCDTTPTWANYLDNERAGSLAIGDGTTVTLWDKVGWNDNNNDACADPGECEGTAIPNYTAGGADGIGAGNQIVRVSSPGASYADNVAYGHAYDSDDNRSDFLYPSASFSGIVFNPGETYDPAVPVIAGKPAVFANVASNDPTSGSTVAYRATISSAGVDLAYALYTIPNVSSGVWTVIIASNTYYKQIANVMVAVGQTQWVPNTTTVPTWAVTGGHHITLDSSTINGFVNGGIVGITGASLPNIQVRAAGVTTTTTSNGRYFLQVSSGPIYVIANPNNNNPVYVQGIAQLTINEGRIYEQDFTLIQGGALRGHVTSGTTPLPNVLVSANIGGSQYGTGTSDNTGVFTIRDLSTGTYTVEPVLDPGQDSSPNSIEATVSSTGTVTVGTFTITGAFGTISGTVKYDNELVTTGALLIASTSTIASTPAQIVASSAPAQSPVYAVSSKADGTYQLQVRGSGTTYKLSAYIPVIQTNGTVTVTTKTFSGISVTAAQDTTFNITVP